MKEIPFPDMKGWTDQQVDDWYNKGTNGMCDNNNSYDALEEVDKLLVQFGLELCIYDAGTSDFVFTIQKGVN